MCRIQKSIIVKYRVFQREWTNFELLSWPYYMQVFAETIFNMKGIVWHFMANFYEPKHIAWNLYFLCVSP